MISLTQINYIVTLLEERNFQRAADKCFVSQPTLSIQLKKAENVLGGKLFNRELNPLEPTPFLLSILPQLLLIDHEFKNLNERVKGLTDEKKEVLRIGIIPTIAHYLIPELYGLIQQQITAYQIQFEELRTIDLLHKLESRKIDLAILSGPIDSFEFQVQKLYVEELFFYMNSTVVPKSVKELEGMQPWLLSEGNCLRSQAVNFCALNEENIQKWSYQGGNIDVLIRMVEHYGGYTLVPANYPQQFLDKSKLVSLEKPKPARSIVACYHQRSSKEKALFELFHLIQSRYALLKEENWELLKWS